MTHSEKNTVPSPVLKGDIVRSYDFPGNYSCYVEGVVEDFPVVEGCRRYRIKVHRDVWQGEDKVRGEPGFRREVIPPVNGTATTLGRRTNQVEHVSIPVPEGASQCR